MTSRRYLVQSSNGICNDGSLAALLTSACSPYQGLEETMMGNAAQKRPLYPIFETSEETVMEDDAGDEGGHQVEKKRRLSTEQVKSLEKNFELENKLEPERKLELAKELGLQPRQVAVWFQNRRARWKTKQLEKDYDILKSNFDALKADFEALSSEKDRLQAEVVRLNGKFRPAEEQGTEQGEGVQDFASLEQPTTKIKPEIEELPLQHENMPSSSDQLSINPLNNNNFFTFVCKKEACSSESEGSEILDIESPRQIDSGLSLQLNRGQSLLPEIQIDPCASNPAQLQIIEDSYRSAYQRIRLEDGSSQEDNCNIFPVLEDQAAISWWDW